MCEGRDGIATQRNPAFVYRRFDFGSPRGASSSKGNRMEASEFLLELKPQGFLCKEIRKGLFPKHIVAWPDDLSTKKHDLIMSGSS